jgi:hypothetical protein
MLSATTRVLVAVFAVLMLLGGLALLTIGPAGVSGLWLVIGAAVVLVALAIERNRYRSEAAERSFESTGPGGGEPSGALEPRFRRTAETFVDPTTGTTMRVFVDGRTGERRYVAEG